MMVDRLPIILRSKQLPMWHTSSQIPKKQKNGQFDVGPFSLTVLSSGSFIHNRPWWHSGRGTCLLKGSRQAVEWWLHLSQRGLMSILQYHLSRFLLPPKVKKPLLKKRIFCFSGPVGRLIVLLYIMTQKQQQQCEMIIPSGTIKTRACAFTLVKVHFGWATFKFWEQSPIKGYNQLI